MPQDDEIQVVELDVEEDILIDLTEADNGADFECVDTADGCRAPSCARRGAYIKDVMGRLVSPELVTIREILPRCFEIMKNSGVDIVLAIDNTTRTMFDDWVAKLEQAAIKILLPGIDNAQQSPALAIPIFFMEGM
jgi:hypothetical protein